MTSLGDQNTAHGRQALQFRSAFGTDVGLKRTLNEDNYLAEFPVFVVADGMGGHDGGNIASAIAIETLQPLAGRGDVTPQEVAELLEIAQQEVSAFADTVRGGAGTTLSGVIAVRSMEPASSPSMQWLVLNIGDSRTYRIRGGQGRQLTVDHSEFQELIDSGVVSREALAQGESVVFRGRNVITRALGDEDSPVDLWLTPIVSGDRVLVVSDGAVADVPEQDLLRVATQQPLGAESPSMVVNTVIQQALDAGGRDNVTAVVVEVVAEDTPDPGISEPGLRVPLQGPASAMLPPLVPFTAPHPWTSLQGPRTNKPDDDGGVDRGVDRGEDMAAQIEPADDTTAPSMRHLRSSEGKGEKGL